MTGQPSRQRVSLCATLSWDGKLQALAAPLPTFFRELNGDAILSDANPSGALRELSAPSLRWIPTKADSTDAKVLLGDLRSLEGVNEVLCFGSVQLFALLLGAGAVNRLHLLLLPKIDGRAAAPALTGAGGDFLKTANRWKLQRMEICEEGLGLHYRVTPVPGSQKTRGIGKTRHPARPARRLG